MDNNQTRQVQLLHQYATPIAGSIELTPTQCTEYIDFETLIDELAEVIEQEGGILIP